MTRPMWFIVKRDEGSWLICTDNYARAFRVAWELSGSMLSLRLFRATSSAFVASRPEVDAWCLAYGEPSSGPPPGVTPQFASARVRRKREVHLSGQEERILRKRPRRGRIGPLSEPDVKRCARLMEMGLGVLMEQYFSLSDIGLEVRARILLTKPKKPKKGGRKCSPKTRLSKITAARSAFS